MTGYLSPAQVGANDVFFMVGQEPDPPQARLPVGAHICGFSAPTTPSKIFHLKTRENFFAKKTARTATSGLHPRYQNDLRNLLLTLTKNPKKKIEISRFYLEGLDVFDSGSNPAEDIQHDQHSGDLNGDKKSLSGLRVS